LKLVNDTTQLYQVVSDEIFTFFKGNKWRV